MLNLKKMSLFLVILMCINLLTPAVFAETGIIFYLNDSFDDGKAYQELYTTSLNSNYKYDTAVTFGEETTGNKALTIGFGAASGGTASSTTITVTKNFATPMTIETGKSYVLSTRIKGGKTGDYRRLFGYGNNDTNYLLVVKEKTVGGTKYIGIHSSAAGNAAYGEDYFTVDEWINLMVVINGTTQKYDIYANGKKANDTQIDLATTSFPYLAIRNATYTASHNQYYDDIKMYAVNEFLLTGSSVKNDDEISAGTSKITLDFNTAVDSSTLGSIMLTDEKGGSINISSEISSLSPMSVIVSLSEAMQTGSEYTLFYSGVKGAGIAEAASGSIGFVTDEAIPEQTGLYFNDTYNGDFKLLAADGGNYTMTPKNTPADSSLTIVNNTLNICAPSANEILVTRSLDTLISFENNKKYVFAVKMSTDAAGDIRRVFGYGSGADDYLFALKNVTGGLGLFTWNSGDRINENKIFIANEWVDFVVILNGSDKTYDLYADGVKMNDTPLNMRNPVNTISSIKMQYIKYGADTKNQYFDNFMVYETEGGFRNYYASTDLNNKIVSTYTQKLEFRFDSIINTQTLSDIEINNGDITDFNICVSADDRQTIIMDVDGKLKGNTEYTIDFSSLYDIFGNGIALTKSFTTDDAINITSPVLKDSYDDIIDNPTIGEVTVSVNVDNQKYNGDISTYAMLVGYYYDNRLMDVGVSEIITLSQTPQEAEATVNVTNIGEGYCIKVFHVNNFDGLRPVKKSDLFDK